MARWHDPVESLTQELAAATSTQARHHAFLAHGAALGLSHFAYVNTTVPDRPFVAETNYPLPWAERYLTCHYIADDPVPNQAQRSPLPFHWREVLDHAPADSPAHRIFDEAAQFEIRDGITVPVHAPAGLSMINMAIADPSLFRANAAPQRHALHLMALQFHLASERALVERPEPQVSLNGCEREVLLWSAKGKGADTIAHIMHRSHGEITHFAQAAQVKLGASSHAEALVKALGHGLITP